VTEGRVNGVRGALTGGIRILALVSALLSALPAPARGDTPASRITVLSEGATFRGLTVGAAAALAVADVSLALDADWPVAPLRPEGIVLLSPTSEWLDAAGTQLALVPAGTPGKVARLTIQVPAARLGVPGDYRVSLLVKVPRAPPKEPAPGRAAATAKSDAPKTGAGPPALDSQRLTLVIKRPEAKLAALPSVLFDPWHGLRPTVGDSVALGLPLTETGARAGVAATVAVESATAPDGRPLVSGLSCLEARVEPGTTVQVRCSAPATDFEIGSTKLTLIVRGAALGAPLEGTVEVRHRRPAWIIIAAILGGLIAGYLVRVLLTAVIKDREVRAKAAALEVEITAAMAHADATFRSMVQSAMEDLDAALSKTTWTSQISGKSDPLGDAIKKAVEANASAAENLRQRRAAEAAAIADLRRITAKDWILPKAASSALKEAARLAAAYSNGETTESEKLRKDAESKLTVALKRTLLEWPSTTQRSIEALEARLAPELATARDGLRALGPRRQALALTTFELDRVEAFMRRLTTFARAIIEELKLLGPRLGVLATTVLDRLDGCRLDAALVARLKVAAATAAAALAVDADNFEDKLNEASDLVRDFNGAVSAFVEAAGNAVASTVSAQVGELLKQQRFVEAAGVIAAHVTSQRRAWGATVRALSTIQELYAKVGGLPLVKGAAPGAPLGELRSTAASGGGPSNTPPAPATKARRARGSLLFAKAGQLVILAVLVVAIGYALLFDRFVGQWSEVAAIFGWSFAIDLSTDVVTNLAKSLLKA